MKNLYVVYVDMFMKAKQHRKNVQYVALALTNL